jgi:peptidoglycan/xylan/chitin deacetylase (PgdA/CDA1 family)
VSGAKPVVLCYHAVSSTWRSALAVTPDRLAVQLGRYAERGYVGLTFAEAERRRQSDTLPPRSLVVTFDDAYASIAAARPVLRELGFPATVFAVGAFLDGTRLLEWPGIEHVAATPHREELRALGIAGLRELHADGWEIGSHTMHHPSLPALADEDCLRELTDSRRLIADEFGSCETIAYPYGAATARVAELAARAGYAAGCYLTYAHRFDEPLRRPRITVSGLDRALREWAKLAPLPVRLRRTVLAGLLGRL